MIVPAIPSDVRERIVSAADALYEQAGRENFPTVDQVRRHARVDMNAASAVMREWRRQQTAQAAPVAVTIPNVVQLAHSQALAALWLQAQDLANESLRTAQTAWEVERAELDAMRQEMAIAYESQATELEATQERATQMQRAAEAAGEAHRKEVETLRADLAAATTRAERAEARVAEIEKRADGLQAELTRAHQDADQVRTALEQLRSQLADVRSAAELAAEGHRKTVDELRADLAATITRAERGEVRIVEIERRADELQQQLMHNHTVVDKLRHELDVARHASAAELEQLRAELATLKAKAEVAAETHQAQKKAAAMEAHRTAELLVQARADRDAAQGIAAAAREEAARLSGQLEELRRALRTNEAGGAAPGKTRR